MTAAVVDLLTAFLDWLSWTRSVSSTCRVSVQTSIEMLARLTISSPIISSIKSSTASSAPVVQWLTTAKLTADDTDRATSLTGSLADQQQMRTASLEVVQSLETVDVRPGLG